MGIGGNGDKRIVIKKATEFFVRFVYCHFGTLGELSLQEYYERFRIAVIYSSGGRVP